MHKFNMEKSNYFLGRDTAPPQSPAYRPFGRRPLDHSYPHYVE
jgi:hypothetical protein